MEVFEPFMQYQQIAELRVSSKSLLSPYTIDSDVPNI